MQVEDEMETEPQKTQVAEQGTGALAARVAACMVRFEDRARVAKEASRALSPLVRPGGLDDLKKLDMTLAKAEAALETELEADGELKNLFAELRKHRSDAAGQRRTQVGRQLKTLCEEEGLELYVISREEPVELRVPPFGVTLDFDRDRADLTFARQSVAECSADARTVLDVRKKAMRQFDSGFDAAKFHAACYQAYLMAVAARGAKPGDRVELLAFLPVLAFCLQDKRFSVDPVGKNYRDYGRAQFAYHVNLLRASGGLEQDGKRMNLGAATGNTTKEKARVIYMEDERGKGEFKLTLFFTETARA